jgi:hypothetical protein
VQGHRMNCGVAIGDEQPEIRAPALCKRKNFHSNACTLRLCQMLDLI